MRKTMTKEVTKTTVTIGRIIKVEGLPTLENLPSVIMIGNVSLEKAQKEVNKGVAIPVTVFGVEPTTEMYEMDVELFIKHATLVETPEAKATREAIEKAAKEAEAVTA